MRFDEILPINPLYPPILGDFINLGGDTPRPPIGRILHLFFSGLYRIDGALLKMLELVCEENNNIVTDTALLGFRCRSFYDIVQTISTHHRNNKG
jgi:hypothetical protein